MPTQWRKVLKLVFQAVWKDPGEPQSIIWHGVTNSIANSHWLSGRMRTMLYRAAGMDISRRALIRPKVIFRTRLVSLDDGVTVNYGCIFDNRAGVTVAKSVGIGIGVQFINTEHDRSDPIRRSGLGRVGAINVGTGASIGSGAIILSGVTIGEGVVVGAGSLVNRDCEPHGLYGGVPAKRIKDLPR